MCVIATWYKAVDEIAQHRGNEHCVRESEAAQQDNVGARETWRA